MREILLSQLPQKESKDLEKIVKALETSLVKAVKEIKPPVVNTEATTVEVLPQKKDKTAYRVDINRDGHGRAQSMVFTPL